MELSEQRVRKENLGTETPSVTKDKLIGFNNEARLNFWGVYCEKNRENVGSPLQLRKFYFVAATLIGL